MLRSALAIALGAAVMSWAGLPLDRSFRDQMVPVEMASDGQRIIYVARYEVTTGSWAQCAREKACSHVPSASPPGEPAPVTGVNWFDVQDYIAWARTRSGMKLRLPTLAEWRELDRTLARPKKPPLFTDPRLAWAADYGQEAAPGGPVRASGSFSTTPEGVSDLDGNVWEWTSSCYKPGFEGKGRRDCPAFIVAGEHEAAMSVFVGNPASGGCATGTPPTHLGFRLVADR
jgi:formylglycine-generating enzyme required for sulfatase activity